MNTNTSYAKLQTLLYLLEQPHAPPDAFDFYADFARKTRGPIHEPMCGHGRYLLPLLAEGLDISGSDSSPSMLEHCRAEAAKLGLKPELFELELGRLELARAPELIFIPSGSFSLLIDDDAVKAALSGVFRALARGGRFVVEVERLLPRPTEQDGVWCGRSVPVPEGNRRGAEAEHGHDTEAADGSLLVFSWLSQPSSAEHLTTTLQRFELVRDGQVTEQELGLFTVRSYVLEEFQALLKGAGFAEIEAFSPYRQAPADADDDALLFACRKA